METIAEPGLNIIRLWGKQEPKRDAAYRLMRYVLRVESEGKTALHNNVTGQLILLNDDEIQIIDALPALYSSDMDPLIAAHFLVPSDYDDRKQVINLRTILQRLRPTSKSIVNYTILPTTACNARCYYCFEQGVQTVTMTEETADAAVQFIADHCGEDKRVFITWFGGEPTVAANRIDRICEGLQAAGIKYESLMYTNGYLFDEKMAAKAVALWHLNRVQMSVDGTEQIYNSVKAYVNAQDSPYHKVMHNIGCMLDQNIRVAVRMNVDYVNYQNFTELMQDCASRFKGNPLFHLCAYALIGEYADHTGIVNHASDSWIAEKVEELNRCARDCGFIHETDDLPRLITNACMADSDAAIVIGADGNLVKCGEQFQHEDAVGNLTDGIKKAILIKEWKQTIEPQECSKCSFYPNCIQLLKCNAGGHCYRQGRKQRYIWNIQYMMRSFLEKEGNI